MSEEFLIRLVGTAVGIGLVIGLCIFMTVIIKANELRDHMRAIQACSCRTSAGDPR